MEADMDYTLLTAAHPLTTARAKLNARQEQEYYERAEGHQGLQEKPFVIMGHIQGLAATLLVLTIATVKGLGHGMNVRKALH
jgi:hypothetical protein